MNMDQPTGLNQSAPVALYERLFEPGVACHRRAGHDHNHRARALDGQWFEFDDFGRVITLEDWNK